MRMWRCWAVCSVLLCLSAVSWANLIIPLSQEDQQKIVDAHNDYRRQERSGDMEYIAWSDELAYGAGLTAQTCINDHAYLTWQGMPFTEAVGQNLFASASDYGPTWPLEYWWSERMYYNYDTTQCSWMCYHYTQMAWWSNNEVGCAKVLCEPLYTPDQGYQSRMYYFVCNYAPGGNYLNQWPYDEGEACSYCQERNKYCKDGLCVSKDRCDMLNMDCECSLQCVNCGRRDPDTCTCNCAPGYFGSGCSTECVDRADECGTEWTEDYCDKPDTQQLMINQCPLLCGFCEPFDAAAMDEWCATTVAPTQASTSPGPTTTLSMYQTLCQLYGLFCDLA